MRVHLIHGMGRSRSSLLLLAHRLQRAGHETSLFGYAVMGSPLERIADEWAQHVTRVAAAEPGAPYAIIGHSLGNVITRLASGALPAGFDRFAMLAPPNRSPALARALRKNRVFGMLTGDAGQKLGDPTFFERLAIPSVPTLVIAGAAQVPWLPYRGAASDGVVAVDETHLHGARHETVTAAHTFIMNDRRVLALLLEFLAEAPPRNAGAMPLATVRRRM